MRRIRWAALAAAGALVAGCGDGGSGGGGAAAVAALRVVVGGAQSVVVGEAAPEPLRVQATDAGGLPVAGVGVRFEIAGGGGFVAPERAVTDAGGFAETRLTAGIAPVRNRVRAVVEDAGGAEATFAILARPGRNRLPEVFATLSAPSNLLGGIEAEDLAFDGAGRLWFGQTGALGFVDGAGTETIQPNPALGRVAGLAFDAEGNLFGADGESKAFVKVRPDGTVETLATEVDGEPFLGPNFAAVDRAGNAYFSDPCLDAIYRVTPEGVATKWLEIPEPNGFAFSADERELWVVSENKDLLCFFRIDDAGLERRGDLMRVPLADGEPAGPVEFVEEDVGNFGDGIALDVEGNLYMVFDLLDVSLLPPSIRLESGVWVRTPEGDFQKWFSSLDTVYANLAFGEGGFEAEDLYLTEFLPENRIFRMPVGIEGLPLIP